MSHSIQNMSFQRRSSQPISWHSTDKTKLIKLNLTQQKQTTQEQNSLKLNHKNTQNAIKLNKCTTRNRNHRRAAPKPAAYTNP